MVFKRLTWLVLLAFILLSVLAVATIAFHWPSWLPFTPVNTLLAFSFAILHAGQREGWRRTLLLALIVFFTGLTFESIGVATGLVYGPYHYTDQLGPKFLGLVPYLIPIAWTMMMYPSLVIAQRILPRGWHGPKRWLAAALIGGIVMTAWDVAMDPLMVTLGNWVWDVKGAYFGVPLQNFWGWWLTTFAAMALYQVISKNIGKRPLNIPDRWAVWAYLAMGLSTLLTNLLIGLEGPALAGIFAMLPWVLLGLVSTENRIVEMNEFARGNE